MRNLKPQRQKSRKLQRKFVHLDDVQKVIDARAFDKEHAFNMLKDIKVKYLKPYHLVHYYYLSVRFHFRCYKQENALEHLEMANDLLDHMDATAYKHKVRINKVNYHFTRAYIKFLSSKLSFDEFANPFQLAKAKRITELALKLNPDNSSFLWLQRQLSA